MAYFIFNKAYGFNIRYGFIYAKKKTHASCASIRNLKYFPKKRIGMVPPVDLKLRSCKHYRTPRAAAAGPPEG